MLATPRATGSTQAAQAVLLVAPPGHPEQLARSTVWVGPSIRGHAAKYQRNDANPAAGSAQSAPPKTSAIAASG